VIKRKLMMMMMVRVLGGPCQASELLNRAFDNPLLVYIQRREPRYLWVQGPGFRV